MQQNKTQQEPVYSKSYKQEIKQKEFREYIASHDVVLAMVKFLLSIKNAEELPENPLSSLKDYFGEYKDEAWLQYEQLEQDIETITTENIELEKKISGLQDAIVQAEQDKIRKEEEEKLRLEEEQNKKGSKKPGKK